MKQNTKLPFDKYEYYMKAVQSPDLDVRFFRKTYKSLRGEYPKVLREDFCGTFAICQEWVKQDPKTQAHGVDLDPEPLDYGRKQMAALKEAQQSRIKIYNQNIFDKDLPLADVVLAVNFSFYIIKDRNKMKEYFSNVLGSLFKDGIFIIDCFGGSESYESHVEETKHKGFLYSWDQDSYDPITNDALFYIHFKLDGKKPYKEVFTYDWRLWSIPELRDILADAGFKKTTVYWEGTTKKGEGDGNFKPATQGEDCESWIAYIVAEK